MHTYSNQYETKIQLNKNAFFFIKKKKLNH